MSRVKSDKGVRMTEGRTGLAVVKMLRFSLGEMRMAKIRYEHIRGTAQVREARLRSFRHVQRKDSEDSCRRTVKKELAGKRQRERP